MVKATINDIILLELHSLGLSTTKISIKLNTSVGVIRKELNRLNLSENKFTRQKKDNSCYRPLIEKHLNKGLSLKQISIRSGVKYYIVKKLINNGDLSNSLQDGYKKCSKCKLVLKNDCFYKSSASSSKLQSSCKKCRSGEGCRKEYMKEWVIKNKDKKREQDKIYNLKNKEKIKAYKKSDKYKISKKKSDKAYYLKAKLCPSKYIGMRIRSMVSSCISKKTFKTFEFLGYNSNDLITHLESKFKDGMTWDNYGRNGWHIDHIKPLASFDFNNEDDLKKAFSLDNLQPLWASDNCSKGSLYNGIRYLSNSSKK